MKKVIALAFRTKTGCRQYSFRSLEEIEKWAKRKPYKDENIVVRMVAPDDSLLDRMPIPTTEFYKYAKMCLNSFEKGDHVDVPCCFLDGTFYCNDAIPF